MSWQLAAFAILALGLAGGFAWYERMRPDARIVALVATLAAFAALGRIAFAALPNVKPTTDVVLVSGYVLGGAPGFIVGALAGLVSNFFFGQGPWTPWQMAAWGATGMLGAGVAIIARRQMGRWALAIVCFVTGYAFAAAQDFGDWVNFSDHSLAQLGVYVGKGTGFDFVHAFGCLVFALAFGPALIHSLRRFTVRLQVTWRPATTSAPVIAAGVALAAAAIGGLAAPAPARAATPAAYLIAAQNPDGGFGPAPGGSSSELYTGWAALGLAAEGYDPQTVSKSGHSATDYIEANAGSATDPGSLERTILALVASGLPVSGQVTALQRDISANGSVQNQVNLTSFAILALRAAGVAPPGGMLPWLEHQQDRDGGFNFATAPGSSDVDDTGAALEAISSADPALSARAVAFIRSEQNSDGGFPSMPGQGSNAQSTAWAVQGLVGAGVGPTSLPRSPIQYLDSLIAPDGHIRYSSSSDQTPVWVTAEAAMALAGKALPLAAAAQQPVAKPAAPRHAAVSAPRPRAAAHRRRPARARAATPGLETLASDAGIAVAVLLAPVGLG